MTKKKGKLEEKKQNKKATLLLCHPQIEEATPLFCR